MKRKFADQLKHKLKLAGLFDHSIKFQKKVIKSLFNVNAYVLLRPLYRIDILLWYLKYYSSTYEAKQNIDNRKILVNNKSVKANYYVKEGDIISLNFTSLLEKNNTYLNIKQKFTKNKNRRLCSFLEYDKYTNTIIVLKDVKYLTSDDYALFITEASQLKRVLYR